ncbi:MAG: xanthine dehydrogenase family protein subunit M [Ilumatobacteraceae bacterium]|jgi:carbon-monoxide dehydrogenase medium subunit|nr:xanthine dehydrogenase family protein subunit M [Ilumatobacteraceae bacterium]MBJ7422738.1 xanthine dehydrogenase family protein subunit M [Ilumatobacteraceae bacterium]
MIPAQFTHIPVTTVKEASDALNHYGDDSKLLAGGHSLIPLMKLRLATPAVLIDIARISNLRGIREEKDKLIVGALTTHEQIENSPLIKKYAPIIAAAAKLVGDPQVRHRGTIGGSVAHGDAASDLSVALFAANASFVATGPNGVRTIGAVDFFLGFWTTALNQDDVLTEIHIPFAPTSNWSYQKFTIRSQDWAVVSVAVSESNIILGAMGEIPLRAAKSEEAIASGADFEQAANFADEGTSPSSDLRASADYRRHLAKVMVLDALKEAKHRS